VDARLSTPRGVRYGRALPRESQLHQLGRRSRPNLRRVFWRRSFRRSSSPQLPLCATQHQVEVDASQRLLLSAPCCTRASLLELTRLAAALTYATASAIRTPLVPSSLSLLRTLLPRAMTSIKARHGLILLPTKCGCSAHAYNRGSSPPLWIELRFLKFRPSPSTIARIAGIIPRPVPCRRSVAVATHAATQPRPGCEARRGFR
jgi:hypothetical protein